MNKVYRIRVVYKDKLRDEEVLPPMTASSYRDAEKQGIRWVEEHRKVSRKEFGVDSVRWDQLGVSPALKDR